MADQSDKHFSLRALVITGVICLLGGTYFGSEYQRRNMSPPPATKDSIVFPIKVYTDTGVFASITGRLAGEGLADKNNVETITCYKDQNDCELLNVSQIGTNQISSLYPALSLPITRWDDDVITASDSQIANPAVCVHVTVNIDRRNKGALMVQEPTNQSALNCAHADNKIYKWTIERSLWEEAALPNKGRQDGN